MKKEKESKVFKELRRIRDEMLAEEKRVGSDKYWAEANREAREFARQHGLKYVDTLPHTAGVREGRAKYNAPKRRRST